jgi:hypothetical protein
MGHFVEPRSSGERYLTAFSNRAATSLFFLWTVLVMAGCHSVNPIDTKPLDNAGMTYDSIVQLKDLQITAPEVAQVASARQAGFSDADCIDTLKTFRARNQPFDAGDAIAGLARAQVSDATILELAKLNQLGLGVGELQAMKLAGLSDEVILEVARHRAEGKPILGGASLAGLKNAGVRGPTLLELARRGIIDSQAQEIATLRKHGASDAEILKRFPGV